MQSIINPQKQQLLHQIQASVMNIEFIKLCCAIFSLFGAMSYLTGSTLCMFYPVKGLTMRGYFYSVATGFGLISNFTVLIILIKTNQKFIQRIILVSGGIFAFAGSVDTIVKTFLSEIVQIFLMLGGFMIIFGYTVLLLRSRTFMKKIVQLSAFFYMVGGGLIGIAALLLTKSRTYFTLAQSLHVGSTSCFFLGANLNLINQLRIFQGYPEYGTKQYLKFIFLGKKKTKSEQSENFGQIQMTAMETAQRASMIKQNLVGQSVLSQEQQSHCAQKQMRMQKGLSGILQFDTLSTNIERESKNQQIPQAWKNNPRSASGAYRQSSFRKTSKPPKEEGFYV